MKLLDERVLYVDTDSIFYKRNLDLYSPNLGDFLGEFTNEIDPLQGDLIIEFVSAGPKIYSYKLNKLKILIQKGGFLPLLIPAALETTARLISFAIDKFSK